MSKTRYRAIEPDRPKLVEPEAHEKRRQTKRELKEITRVEDLLESEDEYDFEEFFDSFEKFTNRRV